MGEKPHPVLGENPACCFGEQSIARTRLSQPGATDRHEAPFRLLKRWRGRRSAASLPQFKCEMYSVTRGHGCPRSNLEPASIRVRAMDKVWRRRPACGFWRRPAARSGRITGQTPGQLAGEDACIATLSTALRYGWK